VGLALGYLFGVVLFLVELHAAALLYLPFLLLDEGASFLFLLFHSIFILILFPFRSLFLLLFLCLVLSLPFLLGVDASDGALSLAQPTWSFESLTQ